MTERERLIKTLRRMPPYTNYSCEKHIEDTADYLLANKCHSLPCDIGDTVYTNCRMQGWYFREKDKPYEHIEITLADLWQCLKEDEYQIRQDWELILGKVKSISAKILSLSDSLLTSALYVGRTLPPQVISTCAL